MHRTLTKSSFGEMQTPHQTVPVQDLRNARFVERIAHGRPNTPLSRRALCGQTDTDAAPIDSVRESRSVIYFSSAQQISEGFAIALHAMGIGAELLPADPAPPNSNSNPEDN
jgi:hypothetical protein